MCLCELHLGIRLFTLFLCLEIVVCNFQLAVLACSCMCVCVCVCVFVVIVSILTGVGPTESASLWKVILSLV